MPRYIDADALKKAIEVAPYNDIDDLTRTERLIDDAPTVDDLLVAIAGRTNGKTQAVLDAVRPKGKWELYQYQESRKKDWYCTNCATIVKKPLEKKYIFCPYCGADMRGDV